MVPVNVSLAEKYYILISKYRLRLAEGLSNYVAFAIYLYFF